MMPHRDPPRPDAYHPGYRPAERDTPSDSGLRRFLGGSPVAVLLRLLFLSILAGALMAMLGLTPTAVLRHLVDLARVLVDLGLDAVHDFGGWLLAGAAVVVPLWLISRLLAVSR